MEDKKENMVFNYADAPKSWYNCFNSECPKANECMHFMTGKNVPEDMTLGNAIYQAVGADLLHMPMRSEDVWRAMGDKKPIDNWITKTPFGSCRSDLVNRKEDVQEHGIE